MESRGLNEGVPTRPASVDPGPIFTYSPLIVPDSTNPTSRERNKTRVNNGTIARGHIPRQASPREGCCQRLARELSHLGRGRTWLAILLGQFCSGLLCLGSISCLFLSNSGTRLPNAQNFAFYFLLSLIFTSTLACRRGDRNLFPALRLRGWKYFLIVLADVQGNFLMVKAYQFTSLTSVQLLDCFMIPTVLSLSWLILRVRFRVPHILGVFLSLLGVSCLVWADVEADGKFNGTGRDRFIGDMMSLGGAFLRGLSAVAQEFIVKTFDWVEYLGMIGLIGSFAAGLQALVLEYSSIVDLAPWSPQSQTSLGLIGLYALSQFGLYCLAAGVIQLSSATGLSLSLLSADFYALIVAIQLFEYKFHSLYFLSFVLVMSGVIVFSIKPTTTAPHLYRSLVREQTTITTDLELLAGGNGHRVMSPFPTTTIEEDPLERMTSNNNQSITTSVLIESTLFSNQNTEEMESHPNPRRDILRNGDALSHLQFYEDDNRIN